MQDILITFLFCAHSILPLFIIVSCIFFSPPPCVYFIPKLYPKLSGHPLNSFTYTWPSSTWVLQEPRGEPLTCSDPEELLPGLLPRRHLEESFGVSLEVLSLSQLPGAFPSEASPLPWWIIFFSSFQGNEVWDRKVWSSCVNASLQPIPMFNEKFVGINLEE